LPRGRFRGVVYGLGVVVLTLLLGGTGFLIYAAQVDDERRVERDHGQISEAEEKEHRKLPPEVREFVEQELKRNQEGESHKQAEDRAHRQHEIEKFHKDVKDARDTAERAVLQASRGIPSEGPLTLVRADPMT